MKYLDTIVITILVILTLQPVYLASAQDNEKDVELDVHLEKLHVKLNEKTLLLFKISNNSHEKLEHIQLELQNEQIELEVDNSPTDIAHSEIVIVKSFVTPNASGNFTLLPTLSYTTTQTTTKNLVFPDELPVLEVEPSTVLPSWIIDYPRELVSVLVGVIVTLVTVGLTAKINQLIQEKRAENETMRMLTAALSATISVLDTPTGGPIPVDTLQNASSYPHFERLLTRIQRRRRWYRRFYKRTDSLDEIPKTLIDLQATAYHYGQIYLKQKGEVDLSIRDKLRKKAERLQSLLQGM